MGERCNRIVADEGKYWGVVIPGLAIAADEMPLIPGLLALDNPEAGGACRLPEDYTLEQVAECHIRYLGEHREEFTDDLKLIGMSMGGMILSIMASKFRT